MPTDNDLIPPGDSISLSDAWRCQECGGPHRHWHQQGAALSLCTLYPNKALSLSLSLSLTLLLARSLARSLVPAIVAAFESDGLHRALVFAPRALSRCPASLERVQRHK